MECDIVKLKSRFNSILDLVENTAGNVIKADEAERQAIEEVRKLGNEVLYCWATGRIETSANELKNTEKDAKGNGKKKIAMHTTFGDIIVAERLFIKPGKQFRPFSYSANVSNRGCSLPLQRVMVDFGADHAFCKVPEKLQEHYGIEIAASTVRALTEKHANQMLEEKEIQEVPNKAGCDIQIGEMDGSMIPIVTIDEDNDDKRKNKELSWKEARLSIVHEKGSTSPKFDAVFQGDVDDAGHSLLNSAILAGFGTQTHLHAVGDGAPWIAEQVGYNFGFTRILSSTLSTLF